MRYPTKLKVLHLQTPNEIRKRKYKTSHVKPIKDTRQWPWRRKTMDDLFRASLVNDVLSAFEEGEKITYSELSKKYGVSPAKITKAIKESRSQWRESEIRDWDELVQRELAMINYVETEALDAWHRSQENAESETTETMHGDVKTKKTVTGQVGDVRFLNQINRCIGQRIKLLGLEPEKTVEIKTWQDRLIEYLKDGRITYDDLVAEIGESLAQTYMQKANLLKSGE